MLERQTISKQWKKDIKKYINSIGCLKHKLHFRPVHIPWCMQYTVYTALCAKWTESTITIAQYIVLRGSRGWRERRKAAMRCRASALASASVGFSVKF